MPPITTTAATRACALPVRVRHVSKTFPPRRRHLSGRHILDDVSLEVAPGEIIALIGASGCGKSTLLRQICGLDRPSSGSILIGDREVQGIDHRCAVGFQEPRLLPWRTIADNVRLGLPPELDASRGQQRVRELLDLVGLTDSARLRPRQVSGGMAQRASLARALARTPGVLLLDEPFGALDALTRLQMHDLLLNIHRAEPATILLVTHDVDEALYLADRIVLLGREHAGPDSDPARIQDTVTVPGTRPRDRGAPALATLRTTLLAGLGVTHVDTGVE